MVKDWWNQTTTMFFVLLDETSYMRWKCWREAAHIHVQNCTLTLKTAVLDLMWKNIWCIAFNFSPPHNWNQLFMLSSSEFFSCQAHKSFSTHQHSRLTLMAPSAVLCDSTWNNTKTLVTVKEFNLGCFSTDSRGTCPDIPGILRWIAPYPGSTVDYFTEERTEPDFVKI